MTITYWIDDVSMIEVDADGDILFYGEDNESVIIEDDSIDRIIKTLTDIKKLKDEENENENIN